MISLVGAGPGPGLLTLQGREALQDADVILYDDLLDETLLNDPALSHAEKIYVGKRAGEHHQSQEEINALLVKHGKTGKHVVRLKGGDSFVFGRGGEEVLALQEAGLPFEVIPGVTSAVAVPESFGIPVTHRGLARSFTVVTGHTAEDGDSVGGESYEALAALQGTLVFLMGLRNLGAIAEKLIAHGKDPQTPAAVLSAGFTKDAARYDGTLASITDTAKDAKTPAIFVVGDVVAFKLSDAGQVIKTPSVSVIGTEAFCRKFAKKAPGAALFPLLEVAPVEGALEPLFRELERGQNEPEWLAFLSQNALRIFFDEAGDVRKLASLKFACVGSATAKLLREYGFTADFVPSVFDRAHLLEELPGEGNVLLLGAKEENGAKPLPARASLLGLYETKPKGPAPALSTDYVVFASTGGVKAFFEQNGTLGNAVPVCIGNPTAEALKRYGVKGHIAQDATIDGLLREIRILEGETE